MGYKINEVEVSVREQVWREKQYASKSRGKKRSQNAVERLPEQVRDLPDQEELDIHANWLISCAIEHLEENEAERLWLEATIPGAWELLEWYFNPIPGARESINAEIECAEWDALMRAEVEDTLTTIFNS